MPKSLLLCLCVMFCLSFCASSIQAAELKIGQRAPDFKLQSIFGDLLYDTKSVFGQNELTILIFWTTNCPDCWKALKGCRDLASKVKDRQVKVLGVNFDTEKLATVRGMIKGEKIDFINLSDFQGKVAMLYQAESYDFSSFMVDRKGILRHVSYDHPPDVDKVLLQKVNEILGAEKKGTSKEPSNSDKGDTDRKD